MTALFLLAAVTLAAADSLPPLRDADRLRLAEAFRLADVVGPRVWPSWPSAPFAVLLVSPTHEYLVGHPTPTVEFQPLGRDTLLAREVYVRPRVFSPGMLATFPAVAGLPTIVMGQPEHTNLSSTRWVLTVLHEHFHQLQYSQPTYYRDVAALGLARGDTTAMWMLNYAFPYQQTSVQRAYERYADVVAGLIADPPRGNRQISLPASLRDLRRSLSAEDFRYLDFQLWQEGVARYTELVVARAAARAAAPSPAFRALPNVTSYAVEAERMQREIEAELRPSMLARRQRVAFYALGAATALALDTLRPEWRTRYFTSGFSLSTLLARASP